MSQILLERLKLEVQEWGQVRLAGHYAVLQSRGQNVSSLQETNRLSSNYVPHGILVVASARHRAVRPAFGSKSLHTTSGFGVSQQ